MLAIAAWFSWKRVTVIAILALEVGVLLVIAWSTRTTPADGIAVRSDQAALRVADQTAVTATLTIDWLVVPGPSWVIVQADKAMGAPGAILGKKHVDAGESTNLQIPIDAMTLPHAVVATLISDRGTVGTFEYSGAMSAGGMGGSATPATSADKPYVADGTVVSFPFAVARLSPNVASGEATVGPMTRDPAGSTVTASYVKAPGQSWLAVSLATTSGMPGPTLGVAIVAPGVTEAVRVPLQPPTAKLPMIATLHADMGQPGQFEYATTDIGRSADQPYVAGGRTVRVPVPRAH